MRDPSVTKDNKRTHPTLDDVASELMVAFLGSGCSGATVGLRYSSTPAGQRERVVYDEALMFYRKPFEVYAPVHGYAVSMRGTEWRLEGYDPSLQGNSTSIFSAYIRTFQSRVPVTDPSDDLPLPSFFGVWHDKEHGAVYLDVSIAVPTLAEALDVARANGQRSIFNLDTKEEVTVT